MRKCIELVLQAKTIQETNELIEEVQALYRSTIDESNKTKEQYVTLVNYTCLQSHTLISSYRLPRL